MQKNPYLSVIIPAYNEDGNVASLYAEILAALKPLGVSFEIIVVNDGSRDKTLDVLKTLRPITIVNFRKNFGQTAALDAGIKAAAGDVIITMDGDGQNDPADIPALLAELNEGFDVVSGWRWQRKDPLSKRVISRGANFLRRFFISDGIHDSGCTLKAYRKECFENLDLYGEIHRFIVGVLRWQGFHVAEVKVNHRPRRSGKTKYTASRVLKGFLDMISVWFWRKYSARPLHLFGGLGAVFFGAGFLLTGTLFVLRFLSLISLQGSIWPLAGFFLMLIGIQLFVSGILGDISVKNYYRIHGSAPYRIKEIIKNN